MRIVIVCRAADLLFLLLGGINESPCSKLQGIKRDRNYWSPLTLTLSLREREYA